MKISFPYMGTSHIAISYLLENLGHEVIYPPKPSKKTLSLGVQHSPEFACLPFKILMGTYLEAVEAGADSLTTSGGFGPCRAGYYGELHKRILHDMGYPVKMLVLEPPLMAPLTFYRNVKSLVRPTSSWTNFYRVFRVAWEKLRALDELEGLLHELRPLAVSKQQITKTYERGLGYIDDAGSVSKVLEAKDAALQDMRAVPVDETFTPLKIGIIGEIYVVLEPFVNHDIEKMLGDMGVYVHRSIFLTNWTKDNAVSNGEKDIRAMAVPYLNQLVGGHGQNSIGETVIYANKGFDGVIQLAPFTCIPEIVAKSIMPTITRDKGIPVMTLFLDEQTGRAGVETRMEAFLDLLKEKRNKQEAI
ncbi:CoA protein activase [Dethiobacter alkaliphilus]|uniref:CoA protein activase n=1 Tax=Dethiobacter alkaliphilus TaxID=427926 RepID=UPI0022273355|nr:CoA protein activase [Dethiobacter alkaliphilus]MCW3489222.1 CoA protein activase [Dethiobacter alkaliphilus]